MSFQRWVWLDQWSASHPDSQSIFDERAKITATTIESHLAALVVMSVVRARVARGSIGGPEVGIVVEMEKEPWSLLLLHSYY
jgi:hypothetical protein